jgi:hypothetical protein
MKRLAVFFAATFLAAAPMVKRDLLASLEKGFAGTLTANQMQIFGYPSGLYIDGFGVVFLSEINLTYAPMVSPFEPVISPENRARTHARELQQLPILRDEMRQFLLKSAVNLDPLPAAEQIVVGVKLNHQTWEDRSGLPSEIVMQGQKSKLMEAKLGKSPADSAIKVQEQP